MKNAGEIEVFFFLVAPRRYKVFRVGVFFIYTNSQFSAFLAK